MEQLPEGCIAEVCSYLDVVSVCRLAQTCAHLRDTVLSSDLVWLMLYERDFSVSSAREKAKPGCGFWLRRYRADYHFVESFDDSFAERLRKTASGRALQLIKRPQSSLSTTVTMGSAKIWGANVAQRAKDRNLRYVQFSGDENGYKVECALSIHVSSHDALVACLPPDSPRFGLFQCSFDYLVRNGARLEKIPEDTAEQTRLFLFWLMWIPESCRVRQKLIHASQSVPIKHALGVPSVAEIQAVCFEDVSIEAITSKFEFVAEFA